MKELAGYEVMLGSKEPPARYEWWLYPTLGPLTIAWKSLPLHFYWNNLLSLETLLFMLGGLLEIWHFRKQRPWTAVVILIAVASSLTYALFNQGPSIKWMYWIFIAIFVYLWLLGKGSELFDRVLQNRHRKK